MQDIDERKPLSGRSRIFANTQSSSSSDDDRERDYNRDDRQMTIRARASRDDSREKFTFASTTSGSGSSPLSRGPTGDVVPPSPLGPGGLGGAGRRLSTGAGSPSSLAAPPSPRRMSYNTGLSPPSSPLRNAIPLAAEDDNDVAPIESKPTSTAPSRPLRSSSSSSAAINLPPSNRRTGAGLVGGNPTSPPTHSSPMLTSAPEVDARLKKMNDIFLASLEGLGGSSGKKKEGKGKERDTGDALLPAFSSSTSPTPFGISGNRPRRGSASTTASASGVGTSIQGSTGSAGSVGQGSDEVIGRLELGSGGNSTGR